jgi:PST family polysaccharide transporter
VTAPLVAIAFGEPALTDVTRALAVTFAFRGIAAGPLAVLMRELAFDRCAVTTLGGTIVESATSITCAYHGAGAWALVAGQIAGAAAIAGLAWLVAPWRPWGTFSFARLWEMSRYGRHVVTANSLGFLGAYLDNIVVAASSVRMRSASTAPRSAGAGCRRARCRRSRARSPSRAT